MKGLKLTQIKSHGFDLNFNRYQLWEYVLLPVQYRRPPVWLTETGRIIHHLQTWAEAHEYFKALAPHYDELDFEGEL
ncbi:hypothetical protein LCGC14_2375310 [marine sediment metagenome]|uniref:Uncharacterized protein n=1 Tax=marine sediment metagenome TaxID=412755 RepID=A0A0F9C2M4_9ZZZZ